MTTLPAIFPSDNIWNANISAMPVISSSETFKSSLGGGTCPLSMWTQIPYVLVPSTQTPVAIHLGAYASESDAGPSPIPPTAPVENTVDLHVLVVQAGTNKLYELYHGVLQGDNSWNADQQSIWDLTSNTLRPDTWTSADGAGLPIFPGLLRYAEVAAGIIPHALRVVVGNTLTDNTHVWPARHHQLSTHNAAYPPMGQRFRLKATTDISGFSTPMRTILQCLKSYGCMVSDMSSTAHQFQLIADLDPGWSALTFSALNALSVNDFEAIDVSSLMLTSSSGQTRGGPLFTVAGISYPVEEGSLIISTRIDERSRLTGAFTDKSNAMVLSKGQKVVASDPTLGTIPFIGYIRASTPNPLIPQPYSFWDIDCPDFFYALEKRTTNRVYPTPTPAGKIAVDLVSDGQYILNCKAASETRSRLDFAGTWTNGTIEVDITLTNDTIKPGFTFRTTVWNNTDDYAYAVELNTGLLDLRKGSNGSGGNSSLASHTFSPKLGTGTYRLRVVLSGTSIVVSLGGVQYISTTDATYGSAGYIALRNRNPGSGGSSNPQAFDNFGVMAALSGTWISPGTSLASVTSIASSRVAWDTS